MTPARFELLLGHCLQRRRLAGLEAEYSGIAQFFNVTPMTLRRWRSGQTPIPRGVELVMEILEEFPDRVTCSAVQAVLERRDLGTTT